MTSASFKSTNNIIPIVLIILYCFVYEWTGIFEISSIKPIVNIIKIIIPLLLIIICFLARLPRFAPFKKYIFFFLLFMIWGIIPTLLSGNLTEAFMQWIKFLPRFLFCVLIGLYFFQRKEPSIRAIKLLVIIAIILVFQYFLLMGSLVSGIGEVFTTGTHRGGTYYGPFGLLGNMSAPSSIDIFTVSLVRLTSFWLEPSNASGFFFMAFFLAEAIYGLKNQRKWRMASITCFIAGFLSLSNAGYFAIGGSLLIGEFIKLKSKNHRGSALFLVICIFLILISLIGRPVVVAYFADNAMLIAITGVRGAPDRPDYDPYEGRIDLLKNGVEKVMENPLGIGFQIPGQDEFGRGVFVSASAPFQWFLFTGLVGLLLILLREMQVFMTVVSYFPISKFELSLFQAWAVIFIQNLAYGTWMNPMYFLIAIIFLANVGFRGHVVVKVAPALATLR